MKSYLTTRNLMVAVALVAVAAAMHFGFQPLHGPEALALIGFGTTQMSPSAARVIDPILSTVAQCYQNNAFVGSALFPNVPVQQRGGKIITFGREAFMAYATQRAPGSKTSRIQIGYSGSSYALLDYSLEGTVPFEIMQEAQAVPNINMGAISVRAVQDIIALQLEQAQATLATTTGNYATSNKNTALSGTSLWSDLTTGASHPIANIETGKEAIRTATGKRPNVAVIGASVYKSLRQHPDILDRIKYTGRDVPTPELLAALFGIDRVVIADAIYAATATTFADVWGKAVVLAYTETAGVADMGRPSYGYTYRLTGYPMVEVPYQDRNAKSWAYPVTDCYSPVIAAATAGYIISPAVA